MPYVEPIPPDAADPALQREYDAALRRAGRIWGIVAIQSHNPPTLRDSIRLYGTVMFGASPLSRAQREMIAVVTSQANDCDY
jgi:alkylhydroperoxidase family enzyme